LLRTAGEKSVLAIGLSAPMGDGVFMRMRLLSKAITAVYDDKLRPFGIGSTLFVLLVEIGRGEPATRAKIARLQRLNRSTLTRDLKAIVSAGLIEEVRQGANGSRRPVALTRCGKQLLLDAQPAWLAAHAQVEALLGKDGVNAVTSVATAL
jgi:DNA-binding MarR family transcriptional regulator